MAQRRPRIHLMAVDRHIIKRRAPYRAVLCLGSACLIGGTAWCGQSAADPANATPKAVPAAPAKAKPKPLVKGTAKAVRHTTYRPTRFSRRAELHYGLIWGVDSLNVKWVESGELIRFNYRVVDAERAQALNDKKSEPSLIDPQAGVSLVIPQMENVGTLRQSMDAEEGNSYWMTFSNKGRLVKRGDHVNIVIGQFRADGLVVD
jgi:hypothetical protein